LPKVLLLEFLHPLADLYAELYTTPDDELLKAIAGYTNETHPKAHMLSGPVQGRLLEMISRMINPERILEIGTFTGYSALCLAKGLKENGMLYTIEMRAEDAEKAAGFFNKSALKDKINLLVGDAAIIIATLKEVWDIVFIDADKVSYTRYYEMVLPHVKPGGYIIADNVLFHGEVLAEKKEGKNAKAIHAFNEHIKHDSRVETVLLTVRDGLMLIRKK
jgi:caffeoyl-CoA O-methyltransferase